MSGQRVVALVREPRDQARLRGALRGTGELLPCLTPNDVLLTLAESPAAAVVVAAYGPNVDEGVSLTRVVRTRHPAVPVLVYYDPVRTSPRELLAYFQAGAAEFMQTGTDDLRRVFTTVLVSAGHRAKARMLVEQLNPIVAAKARALIEYVLEHGDAPLSIEQAASACGIARRTLEKRLAALGYPSPETLIGWCRLLLAAHLLEDQAKTFDEVALQLSFPSGMALRSMLKRYIGITGRALREEPGPVAMVLLHLKRQLQPAPPADSPKPPRGRGRPRKQVPDPS
jgi:AraC-like DNA-binding protein